VDAAEDLPNPDLFEHADQDISYQWRLSLLRSCDHRHFRGVQKIHSAGTNTFSVQGVGA
jgi:hypothetical protein